MQLKVLFVDDEQDLLDLYVELFSAADVQVIVCCDGESAIAAANKERPNLIFIDYHLPKVLGEEIAMKMPEDIPKYLLTGQLAAKPRYNFAGILSKPLNEEKIQSIINSAKEN